MTAKEVELCIEAYSDTLNERYKLGLYTAWHTVAFDRHNKKLPDLKLLMDKFDGKKGQSDAQEVNYQKIARAAGEIGLKLPKSFLEEGGMSNG